MKKVISIMLLAAMAAAVFAGCGGSETASNESTAESAVSVVDEKSENSFAEQPFIEEYSTVTKEESKEKAKKLHDECINRLKEKGITDESYLEKDCSEKELAMIIGMIEIKMSDDEFLEYLVLHYYTSYSCIRITDQYYKKYKDKFPEDYATDPTPIRRKVWQLLAHFPDLPDEKYIEMLEYPIENCPDYAFDMKCYFPMQEAKIAGINFDESKRMTEDDFKEIADMVKSIDDTVEKSATIRQELYKRQPYPDVVYESTTTLLYFNDNADFTKNAMIVSMVGANHLYSFPLNWYNFTRIELRI